VVRENLQQMKVKIFNQYATKVAKLFDISEEELFTKSKRRDIVDARQLLYYACHKRPMPIVYIQAYLLKRGYKIGHTSILHGINAVDNRIVNDSDYTGILQKIHAPKSKDNVHS